MNLGEKIKIRRNFILFRCLTILFIYFYRIIIKDCRSSYLLMIYHELSLHLSNFKPFHDFNFIHGRRVSDFREKREICFHSSKPENSMCLPTQNSSLLFFHPGQVLVIYNCLELGRIQNFQTN